MQFVPLWIRQRKCVIFFHAVKRFLPNKWLSCTGAQVGKLHGIPSVLISDRDVRFTSRFWRELWRLLGTNVRMGSGFHPETSGQIEIFNSAVRTSFAMYNTPVGGE